jgi:hypothetical protein
MVRYSRSDSQSRISKQTNRKSRRELRRRPVLATAGSQVRFCCDSRHCVPEQTKSGLLCTNEIRIERIVTAERRPAPLHVGMA